VPEADLRVVIVDDHPIVRHGTAAVLEQAPGVHIVGTAADGESAIRLVNEHRPDVMVLDLGLPDVSGIDVAQRVRANWPEVAVVVLTGYASANYGQILPQLGVCSVVHKSAPSEQLVTAIRAAAEGQTQPLTRTSADAAEQAELLTVREHEVLGLIAAGFRNTEISSELHVSLNTVEFHVRNLLGKLGVRSRTEAVTRARALGYALPDDLRTR
jgi:DNA-binding NarL/FixJ family response regulator